MTISGFGFWVQDKNPKLKTLNVSTPKRSSISTLDLGSNTRSTARLSAPVGRAEDLITLEAPPPMTESEKAQLFDGWPDRYDQWFTTPIGSLVKRVEWELILDFLRPARGDFLLDAGCGTGIFTMDMLSCGARVVGLDLSLSMVRRAREKARSSPLRILSADILRLPFPENSFDKTVSITALEFIPEGKKAVGELFRVTRKGGTVVVATLNSLSPWAERRREEAKRGHDLFSKAVFRSPEELAALAPMKGETRTAVHFSREEKPDRAREIEKRGQSSNLKTGAFLAARWIKP